MESESPSWMCNTYNGIMKNIEGILNIKLDKNLDSNVKEERLLQFYDLLDDEDLFSLFTECKIKVFSGKTVETNKLSQSLFGEQNSLKSLLNNKEQFLKDKVWSGLLDIYRELESNREKIDRELRTDVSSNRIKMIDSSFEELNKHVSSKVKNDILKEDVNNTTNSMIDDIVSSFQNVMNKNANPFENIMDITNKITEKYHNKIENGEIELDKIIGNLQNNLPGMDKLMGEKKDIEEEKVIIDENFSTADVEVKEKKEESGGFNLSDMMKTAKHMPDLTKLTSMVGKLNDVNNKGDVGDLKNEMDSFLSESLGIDSKELDKNMEDLQKRIERNNLKDKVVEK